MQLMGVGGAGCTPGADTRGAKTLELGFAAGRCGRARSRRRHSAPPTTQPSGTSSSWSGACDPSSVTPSRMRPGGIRARARAAELWHPCHPDLHRHTAQEQRSAASSSMRCKFRPRRAGPASAAASRSLGAEFAVQGPRAHARLARAAIYLLADSSAAWPPAAPRHTPRPRHEDFDLAGTLQTWGARKAHPTARGQWPLGCRRGVVLAPLGRPAAAPRTYIRKDQSRMT